MRVLKPIDLNTDQRRLIAKDIGSANEQATAHEATQWLYRLVNGTLADLSRKYFDRPGSR
jgi:hypothetical protein